MDRTLHVAIFGTQLNVCRKSVQNLVEWGGDKIDTSWQHLANTGVIMIN